jgi:hypothetical protein
VFKDLGKSDNFYATLVVTNHTYNLQVQTVSGISNYYFDAISGDEKKGV